MSMIMHSLAVEIVRFVNEDFPGWVECDFVDAEGRRHSFVDKAPGFTTEMLDASSKYPRSGSVGCVILNQWQDADGRELARISSQTPSWIESTEGLSEFVVLSEQLRQL